MEDNKISHATCTLEAQSPEVSIVFFPLFLTVGGVSVYVWKPSVKSKRRCGQERGGEGDTTPWGGKAMGTQGVEREGSWRELSTEAWVLEVGRPGGGDPPKSPL